LKEKQEVERIHQKNETKQKRTEMRALIPPARKSMERSQKLKFSVIKKEKQEIS